MKKEPDPVTPPMPQPDAEAIMPKAKTNVCILAFPDSTVPEIDQISKLLHEANLDIDIAIIQGRATCVTKQDIVAWHQRLGAIIKANGWKDG